MIALFSGGLDSFAGACRQLSDRVDHFHVLVSGSTHHRMTCGQRIQARQLLAGDTRLGEHVVVPYGLKEKEELAMESSQRSRGFLHICLGAAAAITLGAHRLHIYENGIGALNLPFDATQAGVETSRAVHPKYLFIMERLLSMVTDAPFQILTPLLFSTKSEILSHPAVQSHAEVIRETFSCDRFPDYRESKPQCGACPSCVLRRMSLEAAGLAAFDLATDYAQDAKDFCGSLKSSTAFVLEKYDAQAFRLRQKLNSSEPWKALTYAYPVLREVSHILGQQGHSTEEAELQLVRLYQKHVAEWQSFSGRLALERYLQAA